MNMKSSELIAIGKERKKFNEMINIASLENQFEDIDYKPIKDFEEIDKIEFAKYIYPNHYDVPEIQDYISKYFEQYIKGLM
ncbi:choline kinase [Staphylococcus cohnii]